MERSIGDTIIARFLDELRAVERAGPELADEVGRLIDLDLLRREDPLVELCERLATEGR